MTVYSRLLLLFLLFLLLPATEYAQNKNAYEQLTYAIEPSSLLEVNGRTNINKFCCSSEEKDLSGSVFSKYESEENNNIIFKNTSLKIKIKELDCGAKAINKDLHKTLQADTYPAITIQLLKVKNEDCRNLDNCQEWTNITASTLITIANESRKVDMPIHVKKNQSGHYLISGMCTLMLKDFGIEPPTALMGLIKVKNQIDINFHLEVSVLQKFPQLTHNNS